MLVVVDNVLDVNAMLSESNRLQAWKRSGKASNDAGAFARDL
jgi:hypothetical protein